jgi:hypothetical protein
MAIIKKFPESLTQNLTTFQTYINDTTPNSRYFRITEFKDTFTGGKNGFLIEGSEHLKETTEIKIEILDVNGNPVYYEPGNGVPEYYEGVSKLIAVYVYEDTPIGQAKITVLGELKTFVDDNGIVQDIPEQWRDVYNVKWEREFQINKLLSNEDKVRFYRRPEISINEIVKPIFSNVVTPITQMGRVDGFAQVPAQGEKLSEFSLPTNYLLQINDGGAWTGSVAGTTIELTDLGLFTLADDVISKTDLTVQTPYTINGIVQNFSNQRYTASFNYVEGLDNLKTALTGSFAKILISDLETFVGDVARVKIYRRSQSDLADYQFIQEIQLESNEILRDLESTTKNEEFYGIFDPFNFKEYWVTSSNSLTTEFNQTFLYNSVRLDGSLVEATQFYTSKSIDLTKDSEYTLDFNVRLLQNISPGNYIKFYISGSRTNNNITSGVSQEILKVTSDSSILQKSSITANFKVEEFSNAKLYVEVKGTGWYLADISLRASQETSFSPNEISFIQPIPRTLPKETFEFLFQFYDINNNYIPVIVKETKTFDGGNLNRINKSLELVPSSLYFQFDSGSGNGNPVPPTVIFIDVVKQFLTGSVTFTSRSFDFFNNELSSSQYSYTETPGYDWWQFPGKLEDIDTDRPFLTVQNFTGSRDPLLEDIVVQFIEYTGECEGVSDSIIITRVIDGKGGVNYEIRPYDGTVIRNSDPSSSLEVQAIRIDGVNEIDLRSGLPAGRSNIKLHVQSGSKYITLSEASSSGWVKALKPGITGSGEIDYNAVFNRDSIEGQVTLYMLPVSQSNQSGSILTTLTLTDLQDGLDAGVVLYDADTFTINPRLETKFTPIFSSATASFFRRGTFEAPISCSIEVYPSMSINKDFVPEYWVQYVTHSCNPDISVIAYDEVGNIIPSRDNAATYPLGDSLVQSKQLLVNFVYTEPWTSASVSVDKLFTIVPEGKPGDESIIFEVNPSSVTLAANSRGVVNDFKPSVTDIKLKQGSRYLSFTGSREPGTFHIAQSSITASNITGGLVYFDNAYTESLIISASFGFVNLSGSITYPLEIQPYYTSSVYTASVVQQYTKVLEGPPPIQILINPPNVTLIADEVGFVTPVGYSPANTTIQVKEGDDFLLYNTSSLPGTWKINNITPVNILPGPLVAGSTNSSFITYNRFDYPFVSASVVYNIQVYPFALGSGHEYTSSIYTRTQTFTKNVSVPNARSVELKANPYTINYDRDGYRVSPEGDVELKATALNTTGSAWFSLFFIDTDGSETLYDGPYFEGAGITEKVFFIPGTDAAGPEENKTWRVKITDGNPYTSSLVNPYRAEGQLTIAGIKAGSDAYKISPDNVSTSVKAELFNTDISGTAIKLPTYKGTTPLINVTSGNYPAPQATDYDYLENLIGILGYSSASIVYKSPWIGLPTNRITTAPASMPNIVSWDKPAINKTGEIVYKVDFEGYSNQVATNFINRPPSRQTEFVTQSFAVQFTEPAPYDVKMQNENSSVVYRVSGEVEFDGTSNIIRAYRGGYELTNKPTGFTGVKTDAYGSSSYEYQCTVEITSKSSHITLSGGLVAGSKITGIPATMPGVTAWSSPETNPTAEIVYGINCEGRQTIFKTQSLSVQYEGAVGPGIVMRGEWSPSIDYIGMVETTNNRRDAVTYLATQDSVKYYAAVSGSGPNTYDQNNVFVNYHAPTPNGTNAWWEYLGDQEFFVAAKIAIFEESYVKNTINVGTKDGTGAFANIVLAGGRPDPYIAIGQNATVGTSGNSGTTLNPGGSVIGYNRPGIFLGIYEDGGNGTTGRFSIKTTGTSGKGLFWDGDNLTVVGGIRQREPGIPEGAFRGAWAAGVTYYPDDTVTYSGASYINSFTHLSTNDTNIDTGYPPNATNRWTVYAAAGTSGVSGTNGSPGVSGTNGDPGAGVVYRGLFNTSTAYYHTPQRRDVVKVGSSYYLTNNTGLDGSLGSVWGIPANSNWVAFGAQFSSVATDVLFAQDVYSDRTINVGTQDTGVAVIQLNSDYAGSNQNPSIRIKANGGYDTHGIFMGFDSNVPKLSLYNTGSGKFVKWDGSNLEINAGNFSVTNNGTVNATNANLSGFITATAGQLGNWTIANNGVLFGSSSAGQIYLDPNKPDIRFRNSLNEEKLILANGNLLNPTSAPTEYISVDSVNVVSSGYQTQPFQSYQFGPTSSIVISAGEEGLYKGTPDFSSISFTQALQSNNFQGYAYIDIEFKILNPEGQAIGFINVASANLDSFGGPITTTENYFVLNYPSYINFENPGTYAIHAESFQYFVPFSGNVRSLSTTSPSLSSQAFTKEVDISQITDSGIVLSNSTTNYTILNRTGGTRIDLKGFVLFQGPNGVDTDYNYCAATWHPYAGNKYDLGSSGNRWKTIYTNNAVQVSDARLKNSIEDIDVGLDFIKILKPKKFKFNDRKTPRYYYGLIAQEVTASLEEFGMTTSDNSIIVSSSCHWTDDEIEGFKTGSNWESIQRDVIAVKEGYMNLNYTELIAPLIRAVQQLSNKVDRLEAQISGSL